MARNTDSSLLHLQFINLKGLSAVFRRRSRLWINRRIPAANQVALDRRNIFILPSKQGMAFLFMLFAMFIAAVNYESSLAFALVFLLLSMFLVSMFHTYRNLSGLQFSATENDRVFAGSLATLKVRVERTDKTFRECIRLGYAPEFTLRCSLVSNTQETVKLKVQTEKRGRYKPERLRVETFYPFGLFRAWSLLDLNNHYLVYPAPVACDLFSLVSSSDIGRLNMHSGNDDFYDLREYRPGDSLKHIAWKQYACGRGLYTKQFATHADELLWLTWDMFNGMPVEDRLSRLCYCILELDRMGVSYGLRIPGMELQPSKGQQHLGTALESLALFGMENENSETEWQREAAA